MVAGMLLAALAGLAKADDIIELAEKPTITAPPSWAAKVEPETTDPNNSQLEYLLIDRQLRVEDKGSSLYQHFVMHLGNQSAVDDESHVQLDYRPSNERITLHSLTLRRGDKIIDQLQRARISTLRRELDLEQGIIDGELTTSMVLEDVRVGDVLEYSFTRTTGEDGLGTVFSDSFTTQWSVPVRHSYLRVLHRAERKIAVKNTKSSEQPTIRSNGEWKELLWDWRALAAIPPDSDRPDWYIQYPYIQLSESPSWQAVAHWAQRLYPPVQLSPELQSVVAQVRKNTNTKPDQIIQALRFVQDEVRYTGIEIGPGGYQPQPPDVVLKRRFGDCKEKSYLLVTLLKAFGIDGRLALVNTYRRQATPEDLPSAAAFNHMIVRVRHSGKVYWLDPTRTLQGGTLDTIQQAHFGAALVIDDAGKFETMPAFVLDAPDESIVERFDFKAGVFAKAKMDVESTYLGEEADHMRRYFDNRSKDEVTRQYLNFYKDTFPNINVREPFVVKDDRQANKLIVTEGYDLDPGFTKSDTEDKHYFEFSPHLIRSAAHAPKTIVRTSPLELSYPINVRYKAEIHLPEPWSVKDANETIAGPGFTYHSSVRYKKDTITAEYAFKTLAEHIPAKDVPEHARKLEAVRDDAYYYLSYAAGAGPAPFKLSMAAIFAVLGGILVGGLSIRWLHRNDNPSFPMPAPANAPQGIGGWLILPAMGVTISPFVLAYTLFLWKDYFDAGVWANLGSEQDPVLAHWGKIGVFFMLLLAYALFLVCCYLIYLLFAKRRCFPIGYVTALWSGALLAVVTQAAVVALGVEKNYLDPQIFREIIVAMIWTAYMMRSERVGATFTRTRAVRSQPDERPQAEASLATN